MKKICRWIPSLRCRLLTVAALASFASASSLHAQHRVILFGIDGLSTEGVADAKDPNIHALMRSGAWTMHMHAVRETSSAPNWASMLMGAPPELDGITSDNSQSDPNHYPPACQAAPEVFPNLLSLEREQHPNAKIGFFTDWPPYANFFRLDSSFKVVKKGTAHDGLNEHDDLFNQALAYLASDRPQVLIIHQDQVDDAGHAHGWGSPEYIHEVEDVDAKLGRLMAELDKLGLRKSTDIILVSDHGGKGMHHGGDHAEEINIPWIISGPGIRKNYEIKNPVLMTYDTAATMAKILHVKPSPCWRAEPVKEAFQ